MFKTPNEIQRVDLRCGLILPWYTFGCLEYLQDLNYNDWDVFEWGGGCSTVWYAYNCKNVDTLEHDECWATEIMDYLDINKKINYSMKVIEVPPSANTDHPNKTDYLEYIKSLNKQYDTIVIDGSYRDEAIPVSIECLKPGGHLIFDNFEQDTSGYPVLKHKNLIDDEFLQVFVQPDRRYWKTAVWQKHL